MSRIQSERYTQDVLNVAPYLLGKTLCRRLNNGEIVRLKIIETEAYSGEDDLACHASKGRTPRTEVMYLQGGLVYVYLIYGMYWMLNVVTGTQNSPQAVLIRALEGYTGPGKLTKKLQIDKSFYGENLCTSERIWIEDDSSDIQYYTKPRVGIDYAGQYWKNVQWRFILQSNQ